MKQHMRAMIDGFGIRLPVWATNDQNDPELNDINIWFRDQYKAYWRGLDKLNADPELSQAFKTYQQNVHDECVKQAQRYLDRVNTIWAMPWQKRPAINIGYDPKCFEETV